MYEPFDKLRVNGALLRSNVAFKAGPDVAEAGQ
jgi:hypothetical protein